MLLTVAVPKNYNITPPPPPPPKKKKKLGYNYSEGAALWRKEPFQKSPLSVQMFTATLPIDLLYLINN